MDYESYVPEGSQDNLYDAINQNRQKQQEPTSHLARPQANPNQMRQGFNRQMAPLAQKNGLDKDKQRQQWFNEQHAKAAASFTEEKYREMAIQPTNLLISRYEKDLKSMINEPSTFFKPENVSELRNLYNELCRRGVNMNMFEHLNDPDRFNVRMNEELRMENIRPKFLRNSYKKHYAKTSKVNNKYFDFSTPVQSSTPPAFLDEMPNEEPERFPANALESWKKIKGY